ncbi:MAG: alpha-galactosidase [Caldilineaceae bacterium]|nr:alpha-galactosidase [Caldilineaceae bacterium]
MHVQFDGEQRRWWLTWQDLCLIMTIQDGLLMNEYFGPNEDLWTQSAWGWLSAEQPYPDPVRQSYCEANVQLAPDDRPVQWTLVDWSQPTPNAFCLTLDAVALPLQQELFFVVDEATGLLCRSATLRQLASPLPLDVSHAGLSCSLCLPSHIEQLLYLTGRWGAETQVQQTVLGQAPILLESRAGKSGFEMSPYVALHAPTHTYLCQLAWSGNWQIYLRRLLSGRVQLAAGLHSWGFRQRLYAGDTLHLPSALLLCVQGDLNRATQRLHDYRRRHQPAPPRPLPVHFNTWYPYNEAPQVDHMKDVADQAAALGCESFVVDAGWYTTETENSAEGWWLRTGDWAVNQRLFPHGLTELSDHCRGLGLDFGLWFETEAVGPSAVVRRDHPEWLHHLGGVAPVADQRGILHLGVPAARTFMRDRILAHLQATGATWLKWDFNTDLRQGGWAPTLPEALTKQDPLLGHYQGLYQLQDELRAALPNLVLEMCAGGGGRFDAALMAHAHTYWISDQTAPLMKLAIHFGSQLAHPAMLCNDWLVEWPLASEQGMDDRGDLALRTRVAMLGAFGISSPLERWSASDRATVQTQVAWYRRHIRTVIQAGDQYLLTAAPPLDGQGDWAAIWYVTKDAQYGVLFVFRLASPQATQEWVLPGLDPQAQYRLMSPDGEPRVVPGRTFATGFAVAMPTTYRSALFVVEQLR